MKLGIGTYTYGWNVGVAGNIPAVPMNEMDLIEVACHFDIKLIQIGDNLPLHTFSEERMDHFSMALDNSQISIELGARRLTSANLERYIHLCPKIKAFLLRFLIDDIDFAPTLKEIEGIIQSHIPLLKEYDIQLALENHDRLKATELKSVIEYLGCEQVGICLDTANSFGNAEGIETVVEILAPYTLNLHLKDFKISRLPYKMGFKVEGSPAGSGMLDIPWLMNEIKLYNKCKSAILEQWTIPENTIEQTMIKEKEWASESLSYLTPLFNN